MAKEDKPDGYKIDGVDALFSEAMDAVDKHHPVAKEAEASPSNVESDSIEVVVEDESAEKEPEKKVKTDYRDKWIRASADFDNFRKRVQKEKLDLQRYGAEIFIRNFLPVIDNLERAINQTASNDNVEAMRKGLNMVLVDMARTLEANGVVALDPVGKKFDPLWHEAVETEATNEMPPDHIVKVHLKGYKLLDRLIRPAQVTVAKAAAPGSDEGAKESATEEA